MHDSFDESGFYNTAIVNVGNGVNSRVLVDTGSTGLYLRQDKVGPEVTLVLDPFLPVSFTYGYSSGNQISGFYATGVVSFPEANVPLATGPITFGLVTTIACAKDKPDCPGWPAKEDGVMGVAYSSLPEGEFNPLAQLGGNYGTGFIVVSNDQTNPGVAPRIIVGLTPENTAGFSWSTQFAPDSGSQPAGLNAWNTKSIYTCFTVNNGSPGCYVSVFDTGAEIGSFETGTSGDKTGNVKAGSAVNTTVPNLMSFSTVAGNQLNLNGYAYDPPHGGTLGYNTGAQVFRYYVVAYDAINGRIGFAPLQNVLLGTINAASDADLGVAGGGVYLGGKLVMSNGLVSSRPIVLGTGASLEVQGGLATLNGTLSGTEATTLTMTAGSTLALGGVSSYAANLTVNGGELSVGGSLPAGILLNAATLSGSGTVGGFAAAAGSTIAPGSTLTSSNAIGTMQVLGNGTFAPNATYAVDLGPDGTSDNLSLLGALYAAGTVDLGVQWANPVLGERYRIVNAALGVTGQFNALSAPDFGKAGSAFPFLDPTLVYGADTVDVVMARSGVSFTTAAVTANHTAIALAADSAANAAVTALTGLNAASAPTAFSALAGDLYPTLGTVIQQQSIYVRDAAGSRLRQAFAGRDGLPGAPGITTATAGTLAPTFWLQGLGGWGDLSSDGNADGVSSSIGGVLFGADLDVGDGWRVGVLGGVNRSWVNADGQPASATMNNYDAGLYAGTRQGAFALNLGAAYSWHDIDGQRSVIFPGYAGNTTAAWTADSAQLFGEASWTFDMGTTHVSPLAGLAYVSVGGGSLGESGADAALDVSNGTTDVTYSTLGGRFAAPFSIGEAKVVPSLMLAWQHAFGDLVPTSNVSFATGSNGSALAGVPIAQDAALVEANIAYAVNSSSTLGVRYSGQLAESATQNLITAQWETRF